MECLGEVYMSRVLRSSNPEEIVEFLKVAKLDLEPKGYSGFLKCLLYLSLVPLNKRCVDRMFGFGHFSQPWDPRNRKYLENIRPFNYHSGRL